MDWISFAKEAGAYISPLLMGALIWMDLERKRLLKENSTLSSKVESLAERVVALATRVDQFLFNERKPS